MLAGLRSEGPRSVTFRGSILASNRKVSFVPLNGSILSVSVSRRRAPILEVEMEPAEGCKHDRRDVAVSPDDFQETKQGRGICEETDVYG